MVGPGPLGNAIVLLLCCVSAACRAVIVRWDRMNGTWDEKTQGGRCPRGRSFGVSPSNGGRVLVPPALPSSLFCTKRIHFHNVLTKLCPQEKQLVETDLFPKSRPNPSEMKAGFSAFSRNAFNLVLFRRNFALL